MTDKIPVAITIAVKVGDHIEMFEADATTASDPYEVAGGLLAGLHTDAGRWLTRTGREVRETRRGY